MGKRGKVSPTKDEKSKDNHKERKQVVQEDSSSKSASPDAESGSDIKLESLKAFVVIDSVSRLLAEQALSKVAGGQEAQEKKPSVPTNSTSNSKKKAVRSSPKRNSSTRRKLLTDLQRKESPRNNPRSQKQNPDQVVSQTTRRRRKALTKALKSIRQKPQRPRRSRRTSVRLSSPLKRTLRTRNPSIPIAVAEKDKSEIRNTRRRTVSVSSTKMNSIKENRVEKVSSPSDASNNSSPSSPESENRNEGKSSHESGRSDSDDDVQMQVLEKQVESEKEEDNDSAPEVSLNLPDTDEESSLLSPSALPASQVFRSPISRRKKRKSLPDGSSLHKKLEKSNSLLTSTPILSSTIPVPFYKLPVMPISPSTQYTHMTHSPSIYTPPPAAVSRPSLIGSQGSLPEKRGRGRPRKALADVKSVSGKLYRKKLAERMASSTVDEQRHAQNIYDFHIEHSDEIEPFSYPPLPNPFEDFDPMSMSAVHQMREFYNYDAGQSSTDVPRDPQHMRHRLHRWGDKSTFVYAKHKFVSNENKFKCDVCEVSFTALSSLKRHYGTIYHKQQEAAGRSTLDLSDILRPDRDGNLMEPGPSSGSPLSFFPGSRGRGRGRPALARTSSFVRRSAVDNIKKYYALADAARRRRENYSTTAVTTSSRGTGGFTSSWMQKQQRKRKPLHHSDYLYPSASAESEADDFGCEDEDEENIENGNNENDIDEDSVIERPWLSNVWKGTGPAHFTCEYCGEVYIQKRDFTRHLFYHRQVEENQLALTCPDCLGFFNTEENLEQHFRNFKHGVGVITETRGQKNVQKLECGKCESKFVRREYYRKHIEIHRRPLLQCPHCPKKFLYKFYLNDHIKAKHDGLTNDLSNIVANEDNVASGLPLPTNLVINNVNSTNDTTNNMANSNNFPRPKVELFSSTTTLLIPTETSKRKSQTVGSENNQNPSNARNIDIPSTISKKRNSTPAATPVLRDIPVPSYVTCDPLLENDTPEMTPTRDDYDSKNYENDFEADLSRTLTPAVSSSKGRVSLLQKFLDSQKEQLNQNHLDKNERKKEDDLDNGSSSNSNIVSTSSGLSGIGHSTTEDGKIVFQLEHSMFKGFTSMESGDGDENVCNMSPLTIEIPRDNINLDIEDAASGEDEQKDNTEGGKKLKETSGVEKGVTFHTPLVSPSFPKEDVESEKDRITPFDGNNSNSSTVSAFHGLLGCGVKSNPPVAVDSGNELQCQDCGKMFEHKKSLIKHVRYYTQMESYSCTLCDRSFKLKHHVSRHMKSYHNVDTSSTTSSTSDDINLDDSGDIDCMNSPPSRGDSFVGSGLLVIPSPSSSSGTPVESTTSDSRKQEPTMLTSPHFKNRTYASNDRPNTGRKRSTSGSSKKKLDGDHHGPSTSFSKSNYTTVMDSNGSPVFKCLICKKLYPTKNQLNSHLWYHKRSIPYRCTTCSAEFKFKHDLNAHQQDHYMSERTKFTCERCSDRKTFISRKDFLKHMREIHHYLGRKAPPPPQPAADSPEKDSLSVSRCPLCPLVFPQESDLHEHISADHSKKEIVVCRCGQILGSSELLKTHMLQEHQVSEDGGVENEDGLLEQKQDIGDNNKPISPSPPNSPVYIIKQSEPEDELDDEDEPDEGEPSSSEFELMDVN